MDKAITTSKEVEKIKMHPKANVSNVEEAQSVDVHLRNVYGAQTKEELTSAYGQWAKLYDQQLGHLGWWAPKEAALRIAQIVPATAKVLDVGAGTGLVGRELAELGFENVTALDLSPAMLEEAKNKGVYAHFITADLEKPLPLESASFEVAVGVGVFTQGHCSPSAFPELCRVVRPGGFVVYSLRPDLAIQYGYQSQADQMAKMGSWVLHQESEDLPGFSAVQTKPYRIWVYQRVPVPHQPA